MNIAIQIENYDKNNIFFCDSIKNSIINEGIFFRILYSNSYVLMNGIFLLIKLNDVTFNKYYNKFKCNFNTNINKEIINKIKIIEEQILEKINIQNKGPQYKIYEQMKNGSIKLYNEINENNIDQNFILKISGIWETHTNYGLTYKFIKPLYFF
jgi:Zn-dependent M16 (insulinase) family peptidase